MEIGTTEEKKFELSYFKSYEITELIFLINSFQNISSRSDEICIKMAFWINLKSPLLVIKLLIFYIVIGYTIFYIFCYYYIKFV